VTVGLMHVTVGLMHVTVAQEHTFTWDMISNYEADLEEQAFTFQFNREGKEPRWVKIFSPFVSGIVGQGGIEGERTHSHSESSHTFCRIG